jgi:hypothetical protein
MMVRPSRARRAVPPSRPARLGVFLGPCAGVVAAGIVVRADGLEVPDGRHHPHHREVPLAADLRGSRAAAVADDPDVRRFDELQWDPPMLDVCSASQAARARGPAAATAGRNRCSRPDRTSTRIAPTVGARDKRRSRRISFPS